MIKFLCKTVKGEIEPLQSSKKKSFQRIINNYEDLNKKYIITIESIEKEINDDQKKLYNAFILQASQQYGTTFRNMQNMLKRFHPIDVDNPNQYIPIDRWKTTHLNNFINQASELLASNGFKF